MSDTVTVTEDHLKLLRRMYVGWDDCEYGAPAIDCKRPYGNSDVTRDICEILGWPFDEDDGPDLALHNRAEAVHEEMRDVLQVLVRRAPIEAGTYRKNGDAS